MYLERPGALLLAQDISTEGKLYGVGGFYHLEPANTILQEPATVTKKYDPADLGPHPETTLRAYRWDADQRSWRLVGGVVDTGAHEVAFQIMQYGTYTLAPRIPGDEEFDLTPNPPALPPDGSSATTITSSTIFNNDGSVVDNGTLFTVKSLDAGALGDVVCGNIVTMDEDNATEGVQVKSQNGVITFHVQAPSEKCLARIVAESLIGGGHGEGQIDFSGGSIVVVSPIPNNPPVANNQSMIILKNTQKSITLTATDPDGDLLTYSIVSQPTHGSVSGVLPNVTYTPAANYTGSDSFTFRAYDGESYSNIATVAITVSDSGHSLSGYISDTSGLPVAGVQVCFKDKYNSDIKPCVETDGTGFYIQQGFEPYSKTTKTKINVTPSGSNFKFSPKKKTIKMANYDLRIDFTATRLGSQTCSYVLSLTINPPGSGIVNKNPDKAAYCFGEQVALTAIANAGYSFSSWSGVDSSAGNIAMVTMNSNKLVYAYFTTIGTQGVISLPRTGQTKCYNESGVEISCVGTGQDGEIRAGVDWPNPRFAPSGECVTDNLTGLMWTKNGNLPNGTKTWQEALDYVAFINSGSGLCGYKDWRLPNVNELESLINAGEFDTAIWLNSQGFINAQSAHYWSSTRASWNTTCSEAVDMPYGWSGASYLTEGNYVWPVRSGQWNSPSLSYPANIWKTGQEITYASGDDGDLKRGVSWPNPRFIDHGDGTVTDNLTGLMWARDAGLAGLKTWQEALDYVKTLSIGGYSNWRLPNSKELFSLIDHSKHGPALPPDHPFQRVQSFVYWSSTTNAHNKGSALFGDLWLGIVTFTNKFLKSYIWPVRSGQ